jgi:hypothetical protein
MKKKRQEKEIHLFKVFGALLSANAVTWLPTIIGALVSFSQASGPTSFIAAAQVFFLFQSVVHPIIETTLIKEVREPLKATLFCCCISVTTRMGDGSNSQMGKDCTLSNDKDGRSRYVTCNYRHWLEICGAVLLFDHPESNSSDLQESGK